MVRDMWYVIAIIALFAMCCAIVAESINPNVKLGELQLDNGTTCEVWKHKPKLRCKEV